MFNDLSSFRKKDRVTTTPRSVMPSEHYISVFKDTGNMKKIAVSIMDFHTVPSIYWSDIEVRHDLRIAAKESIVKI